MGVQSSQGVPPCVAAKLSRCSAGLEGSACFGVVAVASRTSAMLSLFPPAIGLWAGVARPKDLNFAKAAAALVSICARASCRPAVSLGSSGQTSWPGICASTHCCPPAVIYGPHQSSVDCKQLITISGLHWHSNTSKKCLISDPGHNKVI